MTRAHIKDGELCKDSGMDLVQYGGFRKYELQRDATNTAVMGLLAAAHMTSMTLQMNAESKLTLSQLYPTVPYIKRFNLKADVAQEVLKGADEIVALLAIPQILAIHEDALKSMLRLVAETAGLPHSVYSGAKSATVHERMAQHTQAVFDADSLAIYHLLRVARNTHIHAGGRADATLVQRRTALPASAETAWSAITGQTPQHYVENEPFDLQHSDLIAMLAVTKRLAQQANEALQGFVQIATWADMAVADWLEETPRRDYSRIQMLRKARGYANRHYAPLALSSQDIADAVDRMLG